MFKLQYRAAIADTLVHTRARVVVATAIRDAGPRRNFSRNYGTDPVDETHVCETGRCEPVKCSCCLAVGFAHDKTLLHWGGNDKFTSLDVCAECRIGGQATLDNVERMLATFAETCDSSPYSFRMHSETDFPFNWCILCFSSGKTKRIVHPILEVGVYVCVGRCTPHLPLDTFGQDKIGWAVKCSTPQELAAIRQYAITPQTIVVPRSSLCYREFIEAMTGPPIVHNTVLDANPNAQLSDNILWNSFPAVCTYVSACYRLKYRDSSAAVFVRRRRPIQIGGVDPIAAYLKSKRPSADEPTSATADPPRPHRGEHC